MTSQAEIIFRREWGRAVAVVTRLTGDLGLAEDAVQDAFASAVGRWASGPLPSDPSGWLITVAKNHATDRLRREARRSGKEQAAMLMLGQRDPAPPPGRIADDQLRLIFACCHPALDPGTRVALTLRILCGLSTSEIARSFLVSEATLAQRLVRAKRKIRAAGIPFRIPADEDLPGRIGGVMRVVYLVFTEGHQASTGSRVVRGELCDEAVRLARLLAGLCPEDPEVLGLLALLLLTDARRDARSGDRLVLLEEQDRSSWDHAKIDEGSARTARASAGTCCTPAAPTCCAGSDAPPRRATPIGPRSPLTRRPPSGSSSPTGSPRSTHDSGGMDMASVEEGIATQIRNIEARYGRPLPEWFGIIEASGLIKHTEVVAMLKADYGMAHGAAHRVSLLSRQAASGASAPASGPATASPGEVADALYAGKKAPLRPLHDQLMAMVHAMGPDVSLAPKKGYVSLRRPGKQFAMIQPSGAGRIDLGLILPGVPQAGRLEPSGSFNALFTHRVRVTSAGDLDDALAGWLAAAYAAAG